MTSMKNSILDRGPIKWGPDGDKHRFSCKGCTKHIRALHDRVSSPAGLPGCPMCLKISMKFLRRCRNCKVILLQHGVSSHAWCLHRDMCRAVPLSELDLRRNTVMDAFWMNLPRQVTSDASTAALHFSGWSPGDSLVFLVYFVSNTFADEGQMVTVDTAKCAFTIRDARCILLDDAQKLIQMMSKQISKYDPFYNAMSESASDVLGWLLPWAPYAIPTMLIDVLARYSANIAHVVLV